MASSRKARRKAERGTTTLDYFTIALGKTFATTSKQLVWFYSINGVAWIWCSYILAFMGKDQIAESLSSNVCSVIIGQIGFYMISKTVENVFKYNIFPWSKNSKSDIPEPTFDIPTPTVQDIPINTPASSCVDTTTEGMEDDVYVSDYTDEACG